MEASAQTPPAKVLEALRQTITSRRRFTDWYHGQSVTNAAMEESNKSHKHFNSVLEELLDVLTPSLAEGGETISNKRVRESQSALGTNPASENPFDILQLECLAFTVQENHLDSASQKVELPRSISHKGRTEVSYEFQDPMEDIQFAVFKMIADLHLVRRHIHERLERYRTRNQSLVSVSAVINCAIGIVRRIEREFMEAMPQFSSWEEVMDAIVSPTQSDAIFRGSSVFSETAYLRTVYCLPFQELRRFRESLAREDIIEHLPDHVMVLRVEASQIDSQRSSDDNKIILHELFKDILSLGYDCSLPATDELTRGVTEVFHNKPIHLWVVFGLQIFLDTQLILGIAPSSFLHWSDRAYCIIGEEVTRPFREFKASADTWSSNMDEYIKYTEVIRKEHFDPKMKVDIRMDSARLKKWTTDDAFMQLREEHNLGSTKPFFFMSHNPVVCGMMQCATLLRSQSEGISIMNALLYAACAAHLYNAAMNEGHLQHHWPDMEELIDLYGRSDIFLGAPPKTISAYCNHHLISRGCSFKNFAKNKREEFELACNGTRLLKVPKIMETFDEYLCQTDATNTEISVDLMEKFLHQIAQRQVTQKKRSPHLLNPVQLLMLLEKCMEDEEAKLVFNYYTLHRSCWMLLFTVYSELREEFKPWMPPERREDNPNFLLHCLPSITFFRLAEERGKKGARKESILAKVGRVMDDYISSKAQNPSATTVGVVDDDGLKTEFEHGTQNDICIHWGVCDSIAGARQYRNPLHHYVLLRPGQMNATKSKAR